MAEEVNRRDFVKTGAAAAALTGITFITKPERVFGANDRVRIVTCGVHGRGKSHLQAFGKNPNSVIAGICDPDERELAKATKWIEDQSMPKADTYTDVRKVLADKNVDAISIAAPNHWHSLMAIWALQAGKDVYCEKPVSHNIWEGQQVVAASKKYDKQIIVHGSQSRAAVAINEAVDHMREGLIGDVYMARGLCFKWRDTIGKKGPSEIPAGVNYDLWTGPAPMKHFTENRFHYNWHWIWDTGNGDIGNQGIHELDKARWGLGVDYPVKVSAMGGHFMFDDDQETPNTLSANYEFLTADGKKKYLEFEVRHWYTNNESNIGDFGAEEPYVNANGEVSNAPRPPRPGGKGGDGKAGGRPQRQRDTVGNEYYGSKGYLAISNYNSYKTFLGPTHEPGPSKFLEDGNNNFKNFVEVVQSRKKEDIKAPIEEGQKSCILIHLANASYRLGRTINFDPATQKVKGDPEAQKLLDGSYRKGYEVPVKV
jgi:predicted dehydrogenase